MRWSRMPGHLGHLGAEQRHARVHRVELAGHLLELLERLAGVRLFEL